MLYASSIVVMTLFAQSSPPPSPQEVPIPYDESQRAMLRSLFAPSFESAPSDTLEIEALVGRFGGRTKVRENASVPAHLRLDRDLGLDRSAGAMLRWITNRESVRWAVELEVFHTTGTGNLPGPFSYDEGNFDGDVRFKAVGLFAFGRVIADFKFPEFSDPGWWIGPRLGFEYSRIDLSILAANGEGSTENFKQFLPYPMAGVAGGVRIASAWSLEFGASFTSLSAMNTIYREGSLLVMSAEHLSLEARVVGRVDDRWLVFFGVRHFKWSGSLQSTEDGNFLDIVQTALTLGLEARF